MTTTKKEITAKQVAGHLTYPEAEAEAIAAAYLALGITAREDPQDIANEIEEAYEGKYANDEEFAQEQADAITSLDTKEMQSWPHYCIDWEQAARELMMDYSEQDGHYFRNL